MIKPSAALGAAAPSAPPDPLPASSPAPAAAAAEAARTAASAVVPASAAPDAILALAPADRLKALIQAHRTKLELVKQARTDAKLGTPEAIAAFATQADALVAWLGARARMPEHAPHLEFLQHWLKGASDLALAAAPLASTEARQARYAALDATFQASRDEASRAMVAASARELAAEAPTFPPGAPSEAVRRALAPAIGHLARSADPDARGRARRLGAGEIPFKVTKGGHLGVQYYAMVAVSGITVSNGAVGPSFFELSPPFQAAVLRHEFTHVLQKTGVRGYLAAMGGNLAQRGLALLARLPFLDGDRLEVLGRRHNRSEQAAYRAEKAFLEGLGWGDRGLLIPDVGMLVGVDTWLEADPPDRK